MELEDKNYKEIKAFCKKGDRLVEKNKFDQAIVKYQAALDLVPSPQTEWEAGAWIYAALADAYFYKEDYRTAVECLYNAMNCPGGITNPFILLRLGESMFEAEEFDKAKEYLLRAYMLEGEELFEDEDEKYYKFIKSIVWTEKMAMAKAILSPDLEEYIESLMEKSDQEYDKNDFLKSIQMLEVAWHKLPEPKGDYSESYHIIMGISETYLLLKDYPKAEEWAGIIYQCALHRIDSGEREFLSGKIAFESGNLEKAKEFFAMACQKSDGRCFEDEDRKYLRFFKEK